MGSPNDWATRVVPTTPALVPLVLAADQSPLRQSAGVSHDVELTVWVDGAAEVRLSGALLWTHFGVSGPVVLNASRHWARATLEGRTVAVTANFCPADTFDRVDERLTGLANDRPRTILANRALQHGPRLDGRRAPRRVLD